MNTQTNAEATTEAVTDWLLNNGFTFKGTHGDYNAAWYDKGSVRVLIEDPESASINIYVFDPRRPKAGILVWDAKYSNAPFEAVTGTITTAQSWARAQTLPTD